MPLKTENRFAKTFIQSIFIYRKTSIFLMFYWLPEFRSLVVLGAVGDARREAPASHNTLDLGLRRMQRFLGPGVA